MNPLPQDDSQGFFQAKVVGLIIDGKAEQALQFLSDHYGVTVPSLRVGTVKRHRQVAAIYVVGEERIYLSKSEHLSNPFVILHEFYHHLRASQPKKKRQAEKRADQFALEFIREFVSRRDSTVGRNR